MQDVLETSDDENEKHDTKVTKTMNRGHALAWQRRLDRCKAELNGVSWREEEITVPSKDVYLTIFITLPMPRLQRQTCYQDV